MSDNRTTVDAGRLWVGGIMPGIVGAGMAIVGLLVARGILDVRVLVHQDGELVNADSWWYAAVAMLSALALAVGIAVSSIVGTVGRTAARSTAYLPDRPVGAVPRW